MSLAKVAFEINAVLDEMQAVPSHQRPRVFISYARPDLSYVQELAAWLERQGYLPWWDWQIEAGGIFEDRIEQEISQVCAVIVLWSDQSIRSDWVKWEAQQGLKRSKLIPIAVPTLDLRDIRPPFNGLNTLTLGDGGRLLDALARLQPAM